MHFCIFSKSVFPVFFETLMILTLIIMYELTVYVDCLEDITKHNSLENVFNELDYLYSDESHVITGFKFELI